MMSLLGKGKEPTSEEIPPPVKERLKIERNRAAKEVEEKKLCPILEVLTKPREEKKTTFTNKTKMVYSFKYHVNFPHQVLNEGIDNTFIFANCLFLEKEKNDGSWGLYFYGTHLSSGSGVGIVLISPDNKTTLFSYMLEFNCTNNIVEYESLILGMNISIDICIKSLHVREDSDLIF